MFLVLMDLLITGHKKIFFLNYLIDENIQSRGSQSCVSGGPVVAYLI